jgi:hypothetical protein
LHEARTDLAMFFSLIAIAIDSGARWPQDATVTAVVPSLRFAT